MDAEEVLAELRRIGDPSTVQGRARFGIPEDDALGVPLPALRRLGKKLGPDTALAKALWRSGVHEARLLATLVADPSTFTRAQAERWLRDVRSWDVCDGLALNLVDRTPWAWEVASAWGRSDDEWTCRAGLATMAGLAIHHKEAPDAKFTPFFAIAEKAARDPRNYVKKAASWALRQMGKRNAAMRTRALASARRLAARAESSSRWVGRDVLKEL